MFGKIVHWWRSRRRKCLVCKHVNYPLLYQQGDTISYRGSRSKEAIFSTKKIRWTCPYCRSEM